MGESRALVERNGCAAEDEKPLRLAGCDAGFGGGLNLKNSINTDKLAGFFDKFVLVKTDLSNRMLNH